MLFRKRADLEACCCNVDASLQYGVWTWLFVGLCQPCGGKLGDGNRVLVGGNLFRWVRK